MGLEYFAFYAEDLRKTAEKAGVPVFIGRYGGDEFTMIVRAVKDSAEIDRLILFLREMLKRADEKLYIDKDKEAYYHEHPEKKRGARPNE